MLAATVVNFSLTHYSVQLHRMAAVAVAAGDTNLLRRDPVAEAVAPGILITGGIEAEEGEAT